MKNMITIDSMRVDIDGKKYELRIAETGVGARDICRLCAFADKLDMACPLVLDRFLNIVKLCVCRQAGFRGYWVEVER